LICQKLDGRAIMLLEIVNYALDEISVNGAVSGLVTFESQTFDAVSRALPAGLWCVLAGAWNPRPEDASALQAKAVAEIVASAAAFPPAQMHGPAPAVAGTMTDPLTDLKRVNDVLTIVQTLSSDRRAGLIAAAMELARNLPIEAAADDRVDARFYASWTVDQPTFADLLSGPAEPPPQARGDGMYRTAIVLGTVYDRQPWDNRSFSPDHTRYARSTDASDFFGGRPGISPMDHPRRSYRGGPPGVGGFVLRARGLAMLFPHVPDTDKEGLLAEIADTLDAVENSPVAKALGLLAVTRTSQLDLFPVRSSPQESDRGADEGTRLFARLFVKALGELSDAALRARMGLVAFQNLPQPLQAEAVRIGIDALDRLATSGDTASNDAAMTTAVLLHDRFAALSQVSDGPRDLQARLLAESAVVLARRIGDPSIRAVFLLALSRWFADPSGSSALLNEAVEILDSVPSGRHPINLEEFRTFRGSHNDLTSWAMAAASIWFEEAVPETLPSLGWPLCFPSPGTHIRPPLGFLETTLSNSTERSEPSRNFKTGLGAAAAVWGAAVIAAKASQFQEHGSPVAPDEASDLSTDPGPTD